MVTEDNRNCRSFLTAVSIFSQTEVDECVLMVLTSPPSLVWAADQAVVLPSLLLLLQ